MAHQHDDDSDAIGAVGNGQVLAYFSGPDIRTMYAPHYSTAPVLTSHWPDEYIWDEEIATHSTWRFTAPRMQLRVFTEVGLPAVTYRFEGHGAGPRINVDPTGPGPRGSADEGAGWTLVGAPDGSVPVAVAEVPIGRMIFVYPSSRTRLAAVTGHGVALEASNDRTLGVKFTSASGWFSLIGADDLAQLDHVIRELHAGDIQLREESALQERRGRIEQMIVTSATESTAETFAQAADQLLAQQSAAGGYIAGDRYPLSYLRDQFGTSAGLLGLGLVSSVERALRFRLETWRHFGDLANAESMGGGDIRHVHENDDVEQTGYLVLSILDLARISPSMRLEDFSELISWCLRRQHEHLAGGALPFNGDETYIAGGMLPRWAIEDGSLEATVLYAECLRRLHAHVGLLEPHGIGTRFLLNDLHEIQASFGTNFVRDGVLVTNSLRRRESVSRLHRTGVCEGCGRFPLGLRRTPGGRFVCAPCLPRLLDPAPLIEEFIPSAALMAIASGTPLITHSVMRSTARAAVSQIEESARDAMITGYDEGLLARALTKIGDNAGSVGATVLKRRDRYGTWAEYYKNGKPSGARCRPWETGMNLLALTTTALTATDPVHITPKQEGTQL